MSEDMANSAEEIILNPSLKQEGVMGLVILWGMGLLLYGSFYPYDSESFGTAIFFILFFLVIVLVFWIPTIFTNHIIVKGDKLFFQYRYSPWRLREIKISEISEIDISVSQGGFLATFTVPSDIKVRKHIHSWDEDLVSHLLFLVWKVNPKVRLPEKYADMAKHFDDKELYEQKKAEYKRRELTQLGIGFIAALLLAAAVSYLQMQASGEFNIRAFGDTFVSVLEGFLD